MKKKSSTPYQFQEGHEKEIIAKLERYCAYTERCEADVLKKLREWKVPTSLHEDAIQYLKDQRFVHEERYGHLYVNGKFKLKGWGKQKIKAQLLSKNIDENVVEASLEEIEDEAYQAKLNQVLSLKLKTMKKEDAYTMKGKLFRYALQKGYESPLIMKWLDEHLNDFS